MFNIIRKTLFLVIFLGFIVACGEQKSNDESKPPSQQQPTITPSLDINEFYTEKDGTNMNKISKTIREQKDWVVPKNIYHAGKRENLLKNIPQIPQDAWDKHLMGAEKTSPTSISPENWGFYGSSFIKGNYYHGDEDPWFVRVTITEECRKPSNVVSLFGLHEDERFKAWFKKTKDFSNLSDFKNRCNDNTVNHVVNCATVFNEFLTETGVKTVFDDKFTTAPSFYLRDRACVEKIYGSPNEIIEMVKNDPIIINNALDEMNQQATVYATMLNIFYEDPSLLSKNLLEDIKNKAQDKIIKKAWTDFFDSFERCQANGMERRLVERMDPVNLGDSYKDKKGNITKQDFLQKITKVCHPPAP